MAGDERLRRAAAGPRRASRSSASCAAGARLAYEVGDGFPGQAWMSRVPLWKADIADDGRLRPRRDAVADGLSSAVALPLRAGGAPAGVVVLVSRTPREPEAGLDRLLEAIGGQVTQFLQRREAEAPHRRAGRRPQDPVRRRARAGRADRHVRGAHDALPRLRDVTRSASVTLWEPRAATGSRSPPRSAPPCAACASTRRRAR